MTDDPGRGARQRSALRTLFLLALGVGAFIVVVTVFGTGIPAAYLSFAGSATEATVTARREIVDLDGYGDWRRRYTLAYRYRTAPGAAVENGTADVDRELYDRTRIGDRIEIRFNRIDWMRRYLSNIGSAVVGSSPVGQFQQDSAAVREAAEWAGVACIGAIGLAWVVTGSALFRFVASLGVATYLSAVVPFGFVAFPALFWLAIAERRKGYGAALVCALGLTAVVLAWRIPWPPAVPAGAQAPAVATVERVRTITTVWKMGRRSGAQDVPKPFQTADLQFTPAGASAPVHAVDRVDADSVPNLKLHATVPIDYSVADPRSARLRGATRTYADRLLRYVLLWTYAPAGVIAFVIVPVYFFISRRLRSSRVFRMVNDPEEYLHTLEERSRAMPPEQRREIAAALTEWRRRKDNRDADR